MSLTLTIENVDRLENDGPVQLKLDRHGAVIGRSPHADWSLPDPKNYISSTHCEIDYRAGQYVLIDKSTNGTMVNDPAQRMQGPVELSDGDVVIIGHYRIRVQAKGGAASAASAPPQPVAAKDAWGWDAPAASAAAPSPPSAWDQPAAAPSPSPSWATPAPAAEPSAWGAPAPAASGWAPAPTPAPASSLPTASQAATASSDWGAPAPQAAPSAWGAPSPAAPAASGWSGASSPAPASDPWGAAAPAEAPKSGWDAFQSPSEAPAAGAWDAPSASAVSGRGPMSQNWSAPRVETPPAPAANPDDVWGRFAASNDVDWTRGGFAEPAAPLPTPAFAPSPLASPASPQAEAAWAAFIAAAGVQPGQLKASPVEAATAAGGMLKRLVAGLVVMLEARARAKSQLGAQSTTLELGGNNPLKFARSPDQALAQLLNPAERGFMEANRAIEDSFQDLQAHQMATLAAMQGALRTTVDRFSPEAIRTRAETRGLLARILPSARNAALWEAYQREFEGVARGSDEAFLEVFAKAFKAAYEKAAVDLKQGGR